MTVYDVLYRKDATFREDKHLTKFSVGQTHYWVATVEGETKDDVYAKMQGEYMHPVTKAFIQTAIHDKNTDHTSMSVGDVLRNPFTGDVYECADVGWNQIT